MYTANYQLIAKSPPLFHKVEDFSFIAVFQMLPLQRNR